jgi:predicted nuclease of predicted toxin-antitoxin system
MKHAFLADESCDFSVVHALREAGHEVVAVVEISPRADDDDVLEMARRRSEILLTEDKDFGQLVYADEQATGGVILMRYPANARSKLANVIVQLIADRGHDLLGRFVVVTPGRIRLGRKPKT